MMQELFLEELSLWGCVWQSTLFAVIGLAGSFLLRRRPARASQLLFLAVIAAVFVPAMSVLVRHFELGLFTEEPVGVPPFEMEIPPELPDVLLSSEVQPAVPEAPTNFALTENGSEIVRIPWRLVTLYGWMIATLILLGRLFVAFFGGIRLLRRAQSDGCERILGAAEAAMARLGITKCLNIRRSGQVRSPMIWCWSRTPVLLVPGVLDGRIDWVDVICHELAHLRRRDHVSGLIAELAVCVLPWNPLLWWSKKRMVRLSEQACDDWVLAGGCSGTDYAQSLLNLSPELQMAFIPTVIGKEKPMKERIYRIVKEKCGMPRVGARWALVVTIIAASATVGVALAQRRPVRIEPPEGDLRPAAEQRERPVLTERMADLKNKLHEMKARFDEVKTELGKLEDSGEGEGDKAQALRAELRKLEEAVAPVERELQGLEGDLRGREMRSGEGQEPRREMLRRLEELGHETELVLQRLAEQNIGRNEEANMLYGRMRELNEQMQQVRQQLGRQLAGPDSRRQQLVDPQREADRERRILGTEQQVHPEAIMRERQELKERARQIDSELGQLRGEHPERAEKLHAELRAIHDAIAQIEIKREQRRRELRERTETVRQRLQDLPDNHPEQVEELRVQLDQIRGQMERIEREPGIPERRVLEVEVPMQLDRPQERDRSDLEREVQNLRKQMDSVNEQMGEMRELMKRLLEKGQSSEAR
jgi:beta-lactamase regulating signal transducer with metallopeptidase domain